MWRRGCAAVKAGPCRISPAPTGPPAPSQFRGNYWVFKWSQENSTHSGQLNSALAALERWLYDLIDAGGDVTERIEHLLRTSDSVAVLGVLMNVGKYRPEFFLGPLKPLLALHRSYLWDSNRVHENTRSSWLNHHAHLRIARRLLWAQPDHRVRA
jgi:hypothetical protein